MNVREENGHLILWDEIALPCNSPKVQGEWSEENIFSIAKALRYAHDSDAVIDSVQKKFPTSAENKMSVMMIILHELAKYYADQDHSIEYWIKEGSAQLANHMAAMIFVNKQRTNE